MRAPKDGSLTAWHASFAHSVLDEEEEAECQIESVEGASARAPIGSRMRAQTKATGPTSTATGQGRRTRRLSASTRPRGPPVSGNAACRCFGRRLGRLRRGDAAHRGALQNGVDSIELLPRLHAALLLERRRKHIIECLAASFLYPGAVRRQIDVQVLEASEPP